MFRGMFRALMLQWLFSSMTRRSAGRRAGPWWGRRSTPPAPGRGSGWSLGRFLMIGLLICAAVFLYNRFRDRPDPLVPERPPYEEPQGGW